MNIFYLDECPVEAAKLQCDKHVVKMILETAQLLSTAHAELDGESPAYKPTHKNHPSAVWVRSSASAYRWTVDHLWALGSEYQRRYGRVHKTIAEHFVSLYALPVALQGDSTPFTPPPQCMPDECKHPHTVIAYLEYYNHKADEWAAKGSPMKWEGQTND